MIFLIVGVLLFHSFSVFTTESSKTLKKSVTEIKWKHLNPEEDIDSWILGKTHFSADNILIVYPYATEKQGGGYLAEIGKDLTKLYLRDSLQYSIHELSQANNRIAIVSSSCFFVACFGQGIKVNKVSYSKPPTIEVVQTIEMPELRKDASWLSFNHNTLELAGSCWQFIRIWEKVKDKNQWQLKTEIIDKKQLDLPETLIDQKEVYKAKIKSKGPSVFTIRWHDDNTLITAGFNGKDVRYWDIKTKKEQKGPPEIEEISLTSTGYRLLSGLGNE